MFLLCFLTLVALLVEGGVTERGAATTVSVPLPPTDSTVASNDKQVRNDNQSVASPANASAHGTHRTGRKSRLIENCASSRESTEYIISQSEN